MARIPFIIDPMIRLVAAFLLLVSSGLAADSPDDITFVGYNLKNYLKMTRRGRR